MFCRFFVLYLVLFSGTLKAQESKIISYFDKAGLLTFVDSSFYYRQETDTLNFFRSFYSSNRQLYFEGKIIAAVDSIDINNTYSGLCTWYYSNGVKKKQCVYSENGVLDGYYEEYYDDGSLLNHMVYEKGKLKGNAYSEYLRDGNRIHVFEENFQDNTNNWNLSKNENSTSKIRIGGLELFTKTIKDYGVYIPYKLDSANFSIEAVVNSIYISGPCKTGFVFSFKNADNYNYFYVSQHRYYIGTIKDGVNYKEIDGFFSYTLKPNDLNSLKLSCINDSFYYYINNKLQTFCAGKIIDGGYIGLCVNNGISCFDKLTVRQYQTGYKPSENDKREMVGLKGYNIPLRSVNAGLVLSNKGYILTPLTYINTYDKIIVEKTVNDTVRQFTADVFYKNELQNFVVLKIVDCDTTLFKDPVFAYSYEKSVETEKDFSAWYLSLNKTTQKFEANFLSGNSKLITSHQQFDDLGDTRYCIGSPIFDTKGYILGILSDIDKELKIKAVDIRNVMRILFSSSKETFHVQKTPLADPSIISREISKNLVLVKTL